MIMEVRFLYPSIGADIWLGSICEPMPLLNQNSSFFIVIILTKSTSSVKVFLRTGTIKGYKNKTYESLLYERKSPYIGAPLPSPQGLGPSQSTSLVTGQRTQPGTLSNTVMIPKSSSGVNTTLLSSIKRGG